MSILLMVNPLYLGSLSCIKKFLEWLFENINIVLSFVSLLIAFASLIVSVVSVVFARSSASSAKQSLIQTREFYIDERLDKLFSLINHCSKDVLKLKNDIHLLKRGQYDYLSSQEKYNDEQKEFLSFLNEMTFFTLNHELGYFHFFCSFNFERSVFISSSSILQNKDNLLDKLKFDYKICDELRKTFIFYCMFTTVENLYSSTFRKEILEKLELAKKNGEIEIANQDKIEEQLDLFQKAFDETNSFIVNICDLLKKEQKNYTFIYDLLNKHSEEIINCIKNETLEDNDNEISNIVKAIKEESKKDSYFYLLGELKTLYDKIIDSVEQGEKNESK